MSAIITELLTGFGAILTFAFTAFVPATVADITLVHFGIWASLLVGMVYGVIRFARSGGKR
jgi:hypothetical protein